MHTIPATAAALVVLLGVALSACSPAPESSSAAGGSAVRFGIGVNRARMAVANSPVGGRAAFSIALVFRADAVGAGDNAQWYGKTGLIDAEQGGVTSDWGTVLTETGNVILRMSG